MAIEKKWEAIPARAFTANGGGTPANKGLVTLASTIDFRVKQQIVITAIGLDSLELEVKRIESENTMYVGVPGGIDLRADLTAFTVSAGSQIFALAQPRPSIPDKEYQRAMFEEEPVVAQRSILVDDFGDKYNKDNRFPVDAEVTVDNLLLLDKPYDSGTETYPSSTQEVVTTFLGGLGGTPVQRVTLNYSDSTKNNLTDFQRETWNGSSWVIG